MINNLQNILLQLQAINHYTKNQLFPDTVFKEETENISDLFDLEQRLSDCIKKLEIINPQDTENKKKLLIEIHCVLFNYIWHIDQIKALIEIVIGRYREAVSPKGEPC